MAEHFKIVRGFVREGITDFEDEISRHIKEGWQLHGNLIIEDQHRYFHEDVDGYVQGTLVAQAMWKPYLRSIPDAGPRTGRLGGNPR